MEEFEEEELAEENRPDKELNLLLEEEEEEENRPDKELNLLPEEEEEEELAEENRPE